ncbi:MAG: type II toxin-antitoxin system VapC family toxin [Deltaproteobacteria bacterium]|nr:type II toxin-antitoxin system VapC family toxin [Deltaproteobacteria bacterium]
MKKLVVDASVMIKWVAGDPAEADQDQAMKLLQAWMSGEVELMAPALWQYEVGNLLGRRLPQEAEEKLALLFNLGIKILNLSPNMCRRCFSWMRERAVTFYDAAYLAAALETGGFLVTADEKFNQRMKDVGSIGLLSQVDLD